MTSIQTAQQNIIAEFEMFETWLEKYEYIIELGQALQPLPPNEKIDQFLITGCQSRVWLVPNYNNQILTFKGDSDALIVKGIVALTLRAFSGYTPQEIINQQAYFIDALGLQQHLSATRSTGLAAMITKIKTYATAALNTTTP